MGLLLRDMVAADAPACAAIACDSEIGERYGFDRAAMAAKLAGAAPAGGIVVVAELDGAVAGFAWIEPRGAFASAPYLRLIAVGPAARGSGVGSALLDEFESRTAWLGRDWCLLVSDFNQSARAFYERRGYRRVGLLPDFAKPGITEVFMAKRRAPPSD